MRLAALPNLSAALAATACGLCLAVSAAPTLAAQAAPAPRTRFERFASHFDLGVSATGEFAGDVSGNVQNTTANNGTLKIHSSSTVGVMGTLRGQKSPYVGGEFNFRYARYTQDYTYPGGQIVNFSAQNTANEFTFGYIARPDHPVFGFQPFVGGGAGTIEFKPTRGSASGLPVQARAAYYYTLGGDLPVYTDVAGVRIGFRQVFYKAPDFGANYLRILKVQSSLEPTIGFYIHF